MHDRALRFDRFGVMGRGVSSEIMTLDNFRESELFFTVEQKKGKILLAKN